MKTNRWKNHPSGILAIAVASIVLLLCSRPLWAQNLGWEGETGVFVTPLAYTAGAEGKIAEPVIGFHFLDAGPVIGQFYEASITVGLGKRFEVGYTSDMHAQGGNAELSPLWQNGFNIFHGKAVLIPENYKKQAWMPAISVGFMARTQVHNVGGAIMNQDTANGDVYLVGTKTITQTKPIPIVLSAGVRGTDAELWGMAGNAPNWQAKGFGAMAFVFKAPADRKHSDNPGIRGTVRADTKAKAERRFRDCASGRSDFSRSESASAIAGGRAGFVRILG
jgi:hypothetical protein